MSEANINSAGEHAILYVDDEAMALKYFRRSLGDGMTVHTASDAKAGLAILAERGEQIAVLVTDQRMPGESGVELLKKVRRRWPHIVRMLTTAYADLDDAIDAVNSGEIFRYITKPWDVKALRAEVSQAMSVFHLQQDHAALLREKMNVWQRLIQLGRLRDLVVMSGSFNHLRHSENAVAAYLRDHLASREDDDLVSPDNFDLWKLTEAEIGQTLTFVKGILECTADITRRNRRFDTRLSCAELLRLGGAAFARAQMPGAGGLPVIQVAEQPVKLLMEALASVCDDPGNCRLQATSNNKAVTLSLPATATPVAKGLTSHDATGLLTAYLLAFHHGGSLELVAQDNQPTYVLTLPVEPNETTLTPPSTGWLESLLVRLEGWD